MTPQIPVNPIYASTLKPTIQMAHLLTLYTRLCKIAAEALPELELQTVMNAENADPEAEAILNAVLDYFGRIVVANEELSKCTCNNPKHKHH